MRVQKSPNDGNVESKIHIFRYVSRKPGHFDGIDFCAYDPNHIACCIEERTSAVAYLNGGRNLQIARIVPYSS